MDTSELPASLTATITDSTAGGGTITIVSSNTTTAANLYKYMPLVYTKIYAGTSSSLAAWKLSPVWAYSAATTGQPTLTLSGSNPRLAFSSGYLTGQAGGPGGFSTVVGDGGTLMFAIMSLAFNPTII